MNLNQIKTTSLNNFALELERKKYEQSFYEFVKAAWVIVESKNKEFKDNWHIRLLCKGLEHIADHKENNLLINIPPRHMKSLLCSVFFPAWVWCQPQANPEKSWRGAATKFVCISHGDSLASMLSQKTRDVIRSEWYQRLWGDRVIIRDDYDRKMAFANVQNGHRTSFTVTSKGILGSTADIIIADDPNNIQSSISSTTEFDAVITAFTEAVMTRKSSARASWIVIQQRVHERDLSGYLLSRKRDMNFTHICLPFRMELHRKTSYPFGSDPRTKEGQILWHSLFPPARAKEFTNNYSNEYAKAGQLQQRPTPKTGGMFKFNWFEGKYINGLDNIPGKNIITVRSWDFAASTGHSADYTASIKMGMYVNPLVANSSRIVILDCCRFRGGPDEVYRSIEKIAKNDGFDVWVNFPKEPGAASKFHLQQLASMLQGFLIHTTPERASKEQRMYPLAAQTERGNVYILKDDAPSNGKTQNWNTAFINELCALPAGQHDDMADAASSAYQACVALMAVNRSEKAMPIIIGGDGELTLHRNG